jgi:L-fucokinase
MNAVSVVGVPEAPSIAKNHGVLVGQKSNDNNGMASHYLQKPSILKMQEAGAIFEDDDCDGGEAVYIDTGVVVFTGEAVNAFLSLLDDSTVNICTSKGIRRTKQSTNQNADMPTDPKDVHPVSLRLELYSDILLAMMLRNTPNDLDTYFASLGISANEIPEGANKNSTYIIALRAIWSTFCRTPLHLLSVPKGMFCHLGTSFELLQLLSSCTETNDSDQNTVSAPRDCNNAIAVKNNKLQLFSKKYSLGNFVQSCVLLKEFNGPYRITNNLTDSYNFKSPKFLGVSINSIFIYSDVNKNEGNPSLCARNSLVEHSVLSGAYSVGSGSIISHVPGFLGENISILPGMMVQCVPILTDNQAAYLGTENDHFANRYILMKKRFNRKYIFLPFFSFLTFSKLTLLK